jgi:hypothetical protein
MIAKAMRLQVYSHLIFDMTEGNRNDVIKKTLNNIENTLNDNINKETQESESLKDFFVSKGLNVVDNRDKGGCLWVIGDYDDIVQYIREACIKYSISGSYGVGKETGYLNGWYTKTQK